MEILLTLLGFIFACLVALLYEYKIKQMQKKLKNNVQQTNNTLKQTNNVHFYVARDKDDTLWLYMGKPVRVLTEFLSSRYSELLGMGYELSKYGLNIHDFDNLKWGDEPVEVFINMKN